MLCSKGRVGSTPTTGTTRSQAPCRAPVDSGAMSDTHDHEALVSPGSTATGAGTGTGTTPDDDKLTDIGTTEADVSDGSEQKQEPVD